MNEKLLLTVKEARRKVWITTGNHIREQDSDIEIMLKAQLAKAEPLIREQKDKEWIETTNKIIDRGIKAVGEAKKDERERIFEEIEHKMFSISIQWDKTFILKLQTNEKKSFEKWQALKGEK